MKYPEASEASRRRSASRPAPDLRQLQAGASELPHDAGFAGAASSWTVNADRDTVTLNGLPASFKLGIGDYIMWRWVTGGEQRRALGRAIEDVTGSNGGSLSIAFEIPLPTLVPAGAVADLANPKCIMKQRTEETKVGEIDALHEGRGTFVAVQDLRI